MDGTLVHGTMKGFLIFSGALRCRSMDNQTSHCSRSISYRLTLSKERHLPNFNGNFEVGSAREQLNGRKFEKRSDNNF
jgi:hypothetical protein